MGTRGEERRNEEGRGKERGQGRGNVRIRKNKKNGGKKIEERMGMKWNKNSREKK